MLVVGITGSLCSGKSAVARFLVEKHAFRDICLKSPSEGSFHFEDSPEDDNEEIENARTMTAGEAMDFVMSSWAVDARFVIQPFQSIDQLQIFQKRPFFLLVSVDAPLSLRHSWSSLSLSEFVRLDDALRFNTISTLPQRQTPFRGILESTIHTPKQSSTLLPSPPAPLSLTLASASAGGTQAVMSAAYLHITNSLHSLASFYSSLDALDLTNLERVRPSWDTYFMKLCDLAAQRSNCMKRRVGCILVKNNRIISTGYNGTPRGVRNCNQGGCRRCNSNARMGTGLDTCLCLHAEENALLEAGRERVDGQVSHVILYCNTCPCLSCAKKIVQVGISEVVYSQEYGMDEATRSLLSEAGVLLRQHVPLVQDWAMKEVGDVPPHNTRSVNDGVLGISGFELRAEDICEEMREGLALELPVIVQL